VGIVSGVRGRVGGGGSAGDSARNIDGGDSGTVSDEQANGVADPDPAPCDDTGATEGHNTSETGCDPPNRTMEGSDDTATFEPGVSTGTHWSRFNGW
jgi:hypothetical protein